MRVTVFLVQAFSRVVVVVVRRDGARSEVSSYLALCFCVFRPFSNAGGSASWCFPALAVDWKFGLFPELRWCVRCVLFLDPEVLGGFGTPVVFLVSFGVLLRRDRGSGFGVWSLRDLDVRGGRFTPTTLLVVRRWCCSG
ncbi:hypothetical protein QL285_059144 [Trifolium repens]|nr:hypothetical protein QL285_059144 [Trifolium repens]